MPRKPTATSKKVTVIVESTPVTISMYPPSKSRKSWYAYWSGLTYARSTNCTDFDEAVLVAEQMVKSGGRRPSAQDLVLSDDEFEKIQRLHYAKRTDGAASKRAQKSLGECLDAISAFREITGLRPITIATPQDCERFQIEALKKPKDWRRKYSDRNRSKQLQEAGLLSANTVVKWSVALQAAFERANQNAGKKCVRSVVPEEKLLLGNPWHKFTWIEGKSAKLRQFDHGELLLLLEYFQNEWPGLMFASLFAKVCLWSWSRRLEVSSLTWDNLRIVGNECHFESIGKWGVEKWFRIPEKLYRQLLSLKDESPFVFACYPLQLRQFYLRRNDKSSAMRIRPDFQPENLGDWMYRRISEWSKTLPKGSAYLHIFRKTTLQYARSGEDVNKMVASDARISTEVMMRSYAKESDEEMRQKSNRTYRRIRNSLPLDVAISYGFEASVVDRLAERLDHARGRQDWVEVARLAAELVNTETDAGLTVPSREIS